MTEDGNKPRRKGNTGRARTSKARELEPSDDIRLADKITRSRQPGDPSPIEQLKQMEGWRWDGIAAAGRAMANLDIAEAKDVKHILQAAKVLVELTENLRSTVATMQAASIETEFETLTDDQEAVYRELYPDLFITSEAPDGPAN